MDKKKHFLVTAALPYANGPVHIGHLAGCYLPADIFVRYLRSCGTDVKFICGSDEHGVPITIKAKKEGITPQQVVDKYNGIMKKSFEDFGITFDHYSRTTNPIHHQTASDFFRTLYDKNVFVEETTEQFYDEEAKQFLADRYITGTCPKCSNPKAYGDQCEKCGSTLNATDLIDPHSALSGSKPVLRKTKNWFLPLDKLQPDIERYIAARKNIFRPTAYGQCRSWLDQQLQPRAMTRDLDWGVKVPVKDAEGKVLYVWFDAPIGYISATKELLPNDWERYWKKQPNEKDNASLIHFIGKDNIVFHCIIFPAMLMAHGDFIVPENVPANEFLNLEGDKISTSRNWAVWLNEYLEEMPDREDELRYVLTSIAPETKDSEFTWKDYQARINNELCSILGNFVNRVMVLTAQNFESRVPEAASASVNEAFAPIAEKVFGLRQNIAAELDKYNFREAMSLCMDLARIGNKYLQENEPWKLVKQDKAAAGTVLHHGLTICHELAVCLQPFLPNTAAKLFAMLQATPENAAWDKPSGSFALQAGTMLGASEILFKKVEDADIEKQIQKLQATKAAMPESSAPAADLLPQKEATTFDDFVKMDIRTGTILAAEKVSGADKLLKLTIDTGIDQRTVVSGIAMFFKPEEIVGKRVSILVNLLPRKLKGIVSNGMILMAENPDGKLVFVTPDEGALNGSSIK